MASLIINEHDILNAFRRLAEWTAEKNLQADILADGGASLIMQTHLREDPSSEKPATKDIDVAFHEVRCRQPGADFPYDALIGLSGTAYLRTPGKDRLFTDFCAAHPDIPLDAVYWQAFSGIKPGRFDKMD